MIRNHGKGCVTMDVKRSAKKGSYCSRCIHTIVILGTMEFHDSKYSEYSLNINFKMLSPIIFRSFLAVSDDVLVSFCFDSERRKRTYSTTQ